MKIEFEINEDTINKLAQEAVLDVVTKQVRKECYAIMQEAFKHFEERLDNKIAIALDTDAKMKIRNHISQEMKKAIWKEAGKNIAVSIQNGDFSKKELDSFVDACNEKIRKDHMRLQEHIVSITKIKDDEDD